MKKSKKKYGHKKRKMVALSLAKAIASRKGIANALFKARKVGLTESQIMHIDEVFRK